MFSKRKKTPIRQVAAEEMGRACKEIRAKQLIFLLNNKADQARLVSFVKQKNGILYNKAEFQFLENKRYMHFIVLGVPDLGISKGCVELGLFTTKPFKKGDIVLKYEGKKVPSISTSTSTGDYVWEFESSKGKFFCDTCFRGGAARFPNQALEKNVDVVNKDGKLYYIARRSIKFGEEITTNYGDAFFDENNALVYRESQTLTTVASAIFFSELGGELENDINSMEDLFNIFSTLGWNDLLNNQGKEKNMKDENKQPIFDLQKNEDRLDLEKCMSFSFMHTTKTKFFIARNFFSNEQPYALFSGEEIAKNTVVCKIDGEHLSNKELKKKTDINDDWLFALPKGKNIYCGQSGSEAFFIHGAIKQDANVHLKIINGEAFYVATKRIKAGEQILAYFDNKNRLKHQAITLQDAIIKINERLTNTRIVLEEKNAICYVSFTSIHQEQVPEMKIRDLVNDSDMLIVSDDIMQKQKKAFAPANDSPDAVSHAQERNLPPSEGSSEEEIEPDNDEYFDAIKQDTPTRTPWSEVEKDKCMQNNVSYESEQSKKSNPEHLSHGQVSFYPMSPAIEKISRQESSVPLKNDIPVAAPAANWENIKEPALELDNEIEALFEGIDVLHQPGEILWSEFPAITETGEIVYSDNKKQRVSNVFGLKENSLFPCDKKRRFLWETDESPKQAKIDELVLVTGSKKVLGRG